MTDFKTISGKKIKFLTSDLTMSSATEGELFYSDTSKEFKVGVTVEAWASGENMPTTRQNTSGVGILTAGLVINGATGPATPAFLNHSTEYDGTDWATVVDTNITAINRSAFGLQTAAVVTGGYSSGGATIASTEEYDGSSWSNGEDLLASRRGGEGGGILAAGLQCGGESPTAVVATVYEYDGTDWTSVTAMPTAVYNAGDSGTTQGNFFAAGGADSFKNVMQIYDATNWTTGGTLNTARGQLSAAGISTAGLAFGGRTPPNSASAVTEAYDGTSWTNTSNLGTATKQMAGFGTSTAAVVAGNDPATNVTQEFTAAVTLKTITDS